MSLRHTHRDQMRTKTGAGTARMKREEIKEKVLYRDERILGDGAWSWALKALAIVAFLVKFFDLADNLF